MIIGCEANILPDAAARGHRSENKAEVITDLFLSVQHVFTLSGSFINKDSERKKKFHRPINSRTMKTENLSAPNKMCVSGNKGTFTEV